TVRSGADGSVIVRGEGQGFGHRLGTSLAGLGDVDGDGFFDLAVGAPDAGNNGLSKSGSVYVYSGATGALLYRLDGERYGILYGGAIANPGDVNQDHEDDLVIGADEWTVGSEHGLGSVWVHSAQPLAIGCRVGNVNAAKNLVTDVLFVN